MSQRFYTLCFLTEEDRILLGMKKRGFGIGRWNGFGGKVGTDETVERAAARELQEECGMTASGFDPCAIIEFVFVGKEDTHLVHIFRCTGFEGNPVESEEMRPRWFAFADIPYDSMWPDDRVWLPRVLAGEKIRGRFLLGEGDSIIEHHLEPM